MKIDTRTRSGKRWESATCFAFVLVCSRLLAFKRHICIYIYIVLRFESNPVLTLSRVSVRSKKKQCQEYCRPIDFIFSSLFQRITLGIHRVYTVTFLFCALLSGIRYHLGIPFSFIRRLDSSYRQCIRVTSTAFPRG